MLQVSIHLSLKKSRDGKTQNPNNRHGGCIVGSAAVAHPPRTESTAPTWSFPSMLGSRRTMAWAIAVLVYLSPAIARADSVIDLTAAATLAVNYQGAIFAQTSLQPTGTGVFDPFVRIQG